MTVLNHKGGQVGTKDIFCYCNRVEIFITAHKSMLLPMLTVGICDMDQAVFKGENASNNHPHSVS